MVQGSFVMRFSRKELAPVQAKNLPPTRNCKAEALAVTLLVGESAVK